VNLGPLPIDLYDGVALNGGQPAGRVFVGCPGFQTVRTCMQRFLSQYAAQGVTGVRFFFSLQGGTWQYNGNTRPAWSTAFDSSGNVRPAWLANLRLFFNDVAANGMKITVAPVTWHYWSGTYVTRTNVPYRSPQGVSCPTGTKTLDFYPWIPFGVDPNDHDSNPPQFFYPEGRKKPDGSSWPDSTIPNQAYNCSPVNPIFWGWSHYFNLVDQLAAQAQAAGITIEEFDMDNEENFGAFTVPWRLAYDNTTTPPTPVLQNLGQILANHGFSAGRVTFSVPATGSDTTLSDCGSVYGDSAHLLASSELQAAMSGGVIGTPRWLGPSHGGMQCDTSDANCPGPRGSQAWYQCATAGMISVPAQPIASIIDIHMYPNDGSGNPTSAAAVMFGDIWTFLNYRNLTGNLVMVGETYSNAANNTCVDGVTQYATQTVAGYEQSTLWSNDRQNVVLRPWAWATYPSCILPTTIGAPSGPYTP
jgi:hypothetical protein